MTSASTPPPAAAPTNPLELVKTKSYLVLLVVGALIGVPVAAIAFFFLKVVAELQDYLFTTLPEDLGFDGVPTWWPLPVLTVAGLLVGLTIRYLPGTAGHKPAEGFKTGAPHSTDRASRRSPSLRSSPSASAWSSGRKRRSSPSAAGSACSRCTCSSGTRRRWPPW